MHNVWWKHHQLATNNHSNHELGIATSKLWEWTNIINCLCGIGIESKEKLTYALSLHVLWSQVRGGLGLGTGPGILHYRQPAFSPYYHKYNHTFVYSWNNYAYSTESGCTVSEGGGGVRPKIGLERGKSDDNLWMEAWASFSKLFPLYLCSFFCFFQFSLAAPLFTISAPAHRALPKCPAWPVRPCPRYT